MPVSREAVELLKELSGFSKGEFVVLPDDILAFSVDLFACAKKR